MRLILCLWCIPDWLHQSQTPSVSFQSLVSTKLPLRCFRQNPVIISGQSTWHQTSRALQHMLNLEVYKPFKAGEIRIRCLGLQSTCSDKTMERLSECTSSESRTRGTGQKLPRQITHKPSHGSVNTDGLLLLPSPLFHIRLQAFNFPFPLSCSPFPISGRVWWLVALLMCSCVFSL